MRKPWTWATTGAASLAIVAAAAYVLAGRGQAGGTGAVTGDATGPVAVRLVPTPLKIYPIGADVASEAELIEAARVVRPYFRRNKVPVVLAYHSLRVWGTHAPFSNKEVPVDEVEGLSGDGLFLAALTDHETYQAVSKVTLERLLVPSRHGIQVVTSAVDAGWGQQWGSSHVGKYIQVMADLGVGSDHPLKLAGLRSGTLADVVRDEAKRYHQTTEPEWIACGLSRYLVNPRWENQFGQAMSIESLAVALMERPYGAGACLGTHVPNALATILNVHETTPVVSPACVEAIRARLKAYSAHLTGRQAEDGSWSADWPLESPSESQAPPEPMAVELSQSVIAHKEKVTATGHHLEWFVLCPPELRPPDPVLRKAVRYLIGTLPGFEGGVQADFHVYLPASHAVRGLVLATGRQWADPAWLREAVGRSPFRETPRSEHALPVPPTHLGGPL